MSPDNKLELFEFESCNNARWLYQCFHSFAGTVGKSFPGQLILQGTYEHTQENNHTGKPLLYIHSYTHTNAVLKF